MKNEQTEKQKTKTDEMAESSGQKRRKTRLEKIKEEGLDGYTNINVRLRNAEFVEFAEQVEQAGLNNNLALRIAARRISGFLELDEEAKFLLRDIAKQIGGIGRNINQMAKIANTVFSIDHQSFLSERQKLGAEIRRLDGLQQELLNVSARRKDGLKLLEKAQS